MKMHLVMAAAFAGLCSHAAFADPEADFWQQPKPAVSTASGTAQAQQCKTPEQVKLALADATRHGG